MTSNVMRTNTSALDVRGDIADTVGWTLMTIIYIHYRWICTDYELLQWTMKHEPRPRPTHAPLPAKTLRRILCSTRIRFHLSSRQKRATPLFPPKKCVEFYTIDVVSNQLQSPSSFIIIMRAIITALMAMLVMQVDAFSVEPRVLAAASILMEWRPKICVGASTSTSTACHHLLRHRQPRILTARSMSSIPDESEPSPMKRRTKVRGRVVGGDRLRESTGIRPSIHPTVINCISEALLLRSRNILGEPTSLFAEYMCT